MYLVYFIDTLLHVLAPRQSPQVNMPFLNPNLDLESASGGVVRLHS